MIARDKLLHFAGSAALTLALGLAGAPLAVAALAVLAVGVAKEAWDSTRPSGWSWGDLVADAVGVAVAVGLLLVG